MAKYWTLTEKQKKLVREYLNKNPDTYEAEDLEYDSFMEIFELNPIKFLTLFSIHFNKKACAPTVFVSEKEWGDMKELSTWLSAATFIARSTFFKSLE